MVYILYHSNQPVRELDQTYPFYNTNIHSKQMFNFTESKRLLSGWAFLSIHHMLTSARETEVTLWLEGKISGNVFV